MITRKLVCFYTHDLEPEILMIHVFISILKNNICWANKLRKRYEDVLNILMDFLPKLLSFKFTRTPGQWSVYFTRDKRINHVFQIVDKVKNVCLNKYIFDFIDNVEYVVYALHSRLTSTHIFPYLKYQILCFWYSRLIQYLIP